MSVCALSSVGHAQDIPGTEITGRLVAAAADPDDCAGEHAGSAIARATATPKTIAFPAAFRAPFPDDLTLVIADTSLPAANGGAVAPSRLFYNL